MTIEEKKAIDTACDSLSRIFGDFNERVCSNCPKVTDKTPTIKVAKENGEFCSKEAGCCSNCANMDGYFDNIYKSKPTSHYPQLKRLKKDYGFNSETGFFNTSLHKCGLPRSKRSYTCSRHCCVWYLSKEAAKDCEIISKIKKDNNIIQ